jgi:hypothetical protein
MYRAYGLLKPDSEFTLQQLMARLTPRFPGYSITRNGDQITIAKGDWEIEMALVAGTHIPIETQGIIYRIAGLEPTDAEAVAASERRVEIWSDTPDPFMEHFNDYLLTIEAIKTFHGLIAVDPQERSLL